MIDIREPHYVDEGNSIIDLELHHPEYGWIPYTFIPSEEDESYDSEIREALKDKVIKPYVPPTQEEKDKANQQAKISEALDYLSKTDFYYIRELARGIKVPQEVEDNRETYIKYLESVNYSTREMLKEENAN